MGPRVAVAGGGLGGLCLAQGLLRSGVDVTVYERDDALAARQQGYRLHLDARAGMALARCLPPELFDLFLATCGSPSRRMTVVSEKLRVLHEQSYEQAGDPYTPAALATSADRQTLREVLAAGLGDRLVFGHELARYELAACGVRLEFTRGQPAGADVLVGADGVNSAVAAQYLPDAVVTDSGGRCIYGRTPLVPEALEALPEPLEQGFMAVAGGQVGMATGLMRYRQRPDKAAAALAPTVPLSPAGDYLMWAVSADQGQFGVPPERLAGLPPAELHALAASLIRRWHPSLRRLQALADVGETFLVRIRTSTPVPAWPGSRVTVLGDAVHAMSPACGSGANTALQDAGLLCRALTGPPSGEAAVGTAIGGYEARMREHGYAAIAASQQAMVDMGARRNRPVFWLYRHLAR
ncbi:MAG TPA: FAD-dependent monooxygenase [Streptosporangiaceae bacterium]|jgi:2-polyprenyl-6-methoxyphenol hydroxylase-like FAD-dependent oxidoreductase